MVIFATRILLPIKVEKNVSSQRCWQQITSHVPSIPSFVPLVAVVWHFKIKICAPRKYLITIKDLEDGVLNQSFIQKISRILLLITIIFFHQLIMNLIKKKKTRLGQCNSCKRILLKICSCYYILDNLYYGGVNIVESDFSQFLFCICF